MLKGDLATRLKDIKIDKVVSSSHVCVHFYSEGKKSFKGFRFQQLIKVERKYN